MKNNLAWLLASLLLLLPLGAPAAALAQEPQTVQNTQEQPFPLTQAALPNGLRVWVQPRPSSESVAALLVLRAGSRYETVDNNGVSHYVEHMVFTGTERWNETEIKEVIASRGGKWNGWTGMESTTYFAHVAAQDLDVALDWLSQIVFHPTFPADKVDKEREVVFQEKWGHYGWLINTLDRLGFGYELDREVMRAVFPGSSLGLRIIGEDKSLESLDRDRLLAYYHRHYTPENAVLVVVGNVTPAQVLARAQELLGSVEPQAPVPAPEVPPLPAGGPHRVTVRGPWFTDQVTLMIGTRTVGRTDPDRWPLMVLAEMLSKELMEEIRYRQGLVYGLSAYNAVYDDSGYFAISTESARGKIEAIRRTVEQRLEEIRQGQVDPEAVAQARAALNGRWALSMEDNVERASWLAQWAFVLPPGAVVPDFQAEIEKVTPEDLPRVVQTYFTPEREFVGLHDPVLTVASGARLAGGVVAVGLAVWGFRRVRRRVRKNRAATAAPD